MSIPCNYLVGSTHWTLVGNTTIKTNLKKALEQTTDDKIFFFFY